MKNRLKLTLLLTAITLLFAVSAKAQIYDGITQPTRFRVWVPVTTSLHDGNATTVAPFIGYKQDVCDWFSVTPVVQYNINSETFTPQVWLNFNVKQKFYVLSRSIYDTRANEYRHTLSATYKLPLGFMVDATTDKTFQKMYQMLMAGDPKKRTYRVLVGDLYRDTQNRDGIIKKRK